MKMKQIKMERSPFYKERDVKTTKKTRKGLHAEVSPEVYHDFMQYVINTGHVKNNGEPNKDKALSELVMTFLNDHVFEQKFFRNLNAILLLPKNTNPDELNEKAQVIGFIDGNDWLEITLLSIFHGVVDYPLRYNFMFTLKDFNEHNYNNFLHYFNKLYTYDETIFFNIDKETQQDFDKVKSRLSELYEDIDIDDAYFVMFPLNNYLDVRLHGVYRSKLDKYEHEGVIVLFEDFYEGVFARVKWSYYHKTLHLSFQFENMKDFEKLALALENLELIQDFRKVSKTTSNPIGKLEFLRHQTLNSIDYLKQELEKKEQKLKDLDEDIAQYYENND